MKVIIGARDLWPTPAIAARILSIIISTDEEIGVRGPITGQGVSSMTEEMAYIIAKKIGRSTRIARPEPSDLQARNWKRDNALVAKATEVFVFFGPDGREGGTEHIVSVALRTGKPIIAYAPDNHGELVEIARNDYEEYEWNS